MAETIKRGRGRPTIGKRVSLGLRVTPDLKKKLDAVAEKNGRSQSHEAELRLQQAFDRLALLPEVLSLAYSRATAGILMMLGRVMEDAGFAVEHRYPRHWWDDPEAYDQALLAAVTVLNELKRPGSEVRGHTATFADQLIRAVRGYKSTYLNYDRHEVETIRSLLSHVAEPIGSSRREDLSKKASKAAAEILALINAQPGTPSQQSIAEVVLNHLAPITTHSPPVPPVLRQYVQAQKKPKSPEPES
jgi:hypothetical protein